MAEKDQSLRLLTVTVAQPKRRKLANENRLPKLVIHGKPGQVAKIAKIENQARILARLSVRPGHKGEEAMKGRISLPGLLLGALTALAAGLLVSHYSFAWLVIGVALGMVMGSALARRSPMDGLRKGEQR